MWLVDSAEVLFVREKSGVSGRWLLFWDTLVQEEEGVENALLTEVLEVTLKVAGAPLCKNRFGGLLKHPSRLTLVGTLVGAGRGRILALAARFAAALANCCRLGLGEKLKVGGGWG